MRSWVIFILIGCCTFLFASEEALSQQISSNLLFKIPWGEKENQIGLLNQPEMERYGPLSFCQIGLDGLLLLDTVNVRVARVENTGSVSTVAKNVLGWSICATPGGDFFVLGDQGLLQYGSADEPKALFAVNGGRKIIEGYGTELILSRIPDARLDMVAIANVDQNVYPIAQGGIGYEMKSLTGDQARAHLGKRDQDGIFYQIKRINSRDIRVLGLDADGKDLVTIPIQSGDDPLGAVVLKCDDGKGGVFVELERLVGQKAELEVHHYARTGELLCIHRLPNDYFTTVYKKTDITSDGRVIQMLTRPEGVLFIQYEEGQ